MPLWHSRMVFVGSRPGGRSYRMSEAPNTISVFGVDLAMNCATTNALFLKLTPMGHQINGMNAFWHSPGPRPTVENAA